MTDDAALVVSFRREVRRWMMVRLLDSSCSHTVTQVWRSKALAKLVF
jgi:hypothetical protein